MIRNRPDCELVIGSVFLYDKDMNTDFMIRLQMCGYTRLEAIILLDELSEDGEEFTDDVISAIEKEKKDVRVL